MLSTFIHLWLRLAKGDEDALGGIGINIDNRWA
jgi:hypothetical protein